MPNRYTVYWIGPTDIPVHITDSCLNVLFRLKILTLPRLFLLIRPFVLLPHYIHQKYHYYYQTTTTKCYHQNLKFGSMYY